MTTLRKHILIGLTVLGVAGASIGVQAQEAGATAGAPTTSERAHGPHRGAAGMAEHQARRQAALHDKLKLSAAQEPAWAAYRAATAPVAPAERPDRAAFAKLSAPEKLEKWIEMAKQHIATQENHLAALKTFYVTLTPEQKAIMDRAAMGGDQRGWHHGYGKGKPKAQEPALTN